MAIPYVPPAPRELAPAVRRRIFVRARMDSYWAGGLFVIVGGLFVLAFCWGMPVDLMIAIAGREGRGTFVSYGERENATINDEHPTTITFRYDSGAGLREVVSSEPDREVLGPELKPGDEIPIEIFAPIPGWARAKTARNAIFGLAPLVLGVAPVIGLAMILAVWITRRGLVRAFVHGGTARGVDVKVEEFRTPSGTAQGFKLSWHFYVNGIERGGFLLDVERAPLDALATGGEVPVLYDPADPTTNTLWIATD